MGDIAAGGLEQSGSDPCTARIVELEQQVATLQQAVATNRTIGAAVGLLMAHRNLTREQAFALLITQSQTTNTKLAAVALGLVQAAEASSAKAETAAAAEFTAVTSRGGRAPAPPRGPSIILTPRRSRD